MSEWNRQGRDNQRTGQFGDAGRGQDFERSQREGFGRNGRDDENRSFGSEAGQDRFTGSSQGYRSQGSGSHGYGSPGSQDYGSQGYGSQGYGGQGYGAESYGGGYPDQGRAQTGQRYGQDFGRTSGSGQQSAQRSDQYGSGGGQGGNWLDRAAERMTSIFGGQDQLGEHRGRGPKNYTRSDDRIREDVNDRLTDDPWLDASELEVQVSQCEVTLTGTAKRREDRRRAEDLAEQVSGVKHVQNNIRVQQTGASQSGAQTGLGAQGTTPGQGPR